MKKRSILLLSNRLKRVTRRGKINPLLFNFMNIKEIRIENYLVSQVLAEIKAIDGIENH